jgi:hypothetical protein
MQPRTSKPTDATDATNRLWAAHFAAALRCKEKLPPGAGWLTIREAMAQSKANGVIIGRGKMRRILRAQIKSGAMEEFIGQAFGPRAGRGDGKQHLFRNVWYRPKAMPIRPN